MHILVKHNRKTKTSDCENSKLAVFFPPLSPLLNLVMIYLFWLIVSSKHTENNLQQNNYENNH